jgi:futalosine hydrolase
MTRLLVVTAVAAERDAIRSAASSAELTVVAGGVGPACAAAASATALAAAEYDLVLCAGIAGGFVPTNVGDVVVASSIVFADLGAETPAGFVPVSELGFGSERYDVAPAVVADLDARTGAAAGAILTVATVTGTAPTAAALLRRYPDAVAEAMEGAGVATAAVLAGVPFGEVRAISNLVGPRDRDAWRIPEALTALGRAFAAIVAP